MIFRSENPCFQSVLLCYLISMKHVIPESENLPRKWVTETMTVFSEDNVLTWSSHCAPLRPPAAPLPPQLVPVFPRSITKSSSCPLRLAWPWLQYKGRKKTKARTESEIGGDRLEFPSNLAGPAEWSTVLPPSPPEPPRGGLCRTSAHCHSSATPAADTCTGLGEPTRKSLSATRFTWILWER